MFYNSASTNPELPIEIQELARTPFSDAMDLIGAVLKLLGIFLLFGAGIIFYVTYFIK